MGVGLLSLDRHEKRAGRHGAGIVGEQRDHRVGIVQNSDHRQAVGQAVKPYADVVLTTHLPHPVSPSATSVDSVWGTFMCLRVRNVMFLTTGAATTLP